MIVSLIIWDTPYIPALEQLIGESITQCRTKEAAMEHLPEAEIAIVMGGAGLPVDEEMLDAAKKLKLILSVSAGVDKLPLQSLHRRGISVCNTRGAHAVSIAEFVLGGMLAMSHHFPSYIRNQEKAQWRTFFSGDDLEGQTVCIIGAGSIGSEIGKKAKAFDMRVVGLKRHPEPLDYFDEVWGIDRLHDALPLSDYVVLITPLTPETQHLMGAAEFRAMKDTAVFINVSRGDTVDEQALISALKHKEIAGAVLDVFHTEPLPKESPLWSMENVMVTPHNAGPSTNSERKTIRLIHDNIVRLRNGQELINKIGTLY